MARNKQTELEKVKQISRNLNVTVIGGFHQKPSTREFYAIIIDVGEVAILKYLPASSIEGAAFEYERRLHTIDDVPDYAWESVMETLRMELEHLNALQSRAASAITTLLDDSPMPKELEF